MKIFLSYASQDQESAQMLTKKLEAKGHQVWDPERDLISGSDWASTLMKEMKSAEAMIVLLSPEAVDSRWVSHEIEYALGAKRLQDRLIPVLVRPTKKIPWILRELQLVKLGDNPEKATQEILERLQHSQHGSQATK
jgi:TIR domain-containing protein